MPAITNIANPEKKVLDANDRYLQNYVVRENNSYTYVLNYDFNGAGAMPNYTWTAPSGNVFQFDTSVGQFQMDSTAFTSMTAPQKKIFFRYLQKFVGECIKNYNLNYNL